MEKTFCVIGAGTYGCYLVNALAEKFPQSTIYLVEAGNQNIQTESEMGYTSFLQESAYKAASHGRYFGLGGTSAKWGGQLLFFSKNDFQNCPEMEPVVQANEKYKNKVLARFFEKPLILPEKSLNEKMYIKQGIWLKIQKRNLFTLFKIGKKKNVQILTGCRVTQILYSNGIIHSIVINDKEETQELKADEYYLTVGALESLRLLNVSGIKNIEEESLGFSDHVSLRCFEILSNSGTIGPVDFRFKFKKGSMITSRITGEMDGVSYYAHPIFNESFTLFQLLKDIIFKGRFSLVKSIAATKQIVSFFPFLYHYFFRKDLFIYKSWFLNIDIELFQSENKLSLSKNKDVYNEAGLDIMFSITTSTLDRLSLARDKVKKFLISNNVAFNEMNTDATTNKVEDVYHPYALFRYNTCETIFDVYHPLQNMFMFNTGLLKRAGSINPTASIFCLIEQHLDDLKN